MFVDSLLIRLPSFTSLTVFKQHKLSNAENACLLHIPDSQIGVLLNSHSERTVGKGEGGRGKGLHTLVNVEVWVVLFGQWPVLRVFVCLEAVSTE